MSSTLRVDMPDAPPGLASHIVLSVRDSKLHTVATARVGEVVALPPGSFLVTAELPGQPGVAVNLEPGEEARINLSPGELWSNPYSGSSAPPEAWQERELWLAPVELQGRRLGPGQDMPRLEVGDSAIRFFAPEPTWIGVRAEGLPARVIALPTLAPDEDCALDLASPLRAKDPLIMRFSQGDPAGAELGRFLVAGDPHAAQAQAQVALDSLEDRAQHPISGTLAALVLLRLGEHEAMKTWPRYLARNFPHADGAIAWAELAWRRGEEAESAQFTRKAISRGVPIFTESLGMANLQLSRWLRITESRGGGAQEALKRASGFLSALNRWSIPGAVTVQVRLPEKYAASLVWGSAGTGVKVLAG